MNSLLLDTHTTVWTVQASSYLSQAARRAMADSNAHLLVSPASAWEIATKVRIGKMPEGKQLADSFVATMRLARITVLPIDAETALLAGNMPGAHRDPFDRIIAAQALLLDVPVISADAQLDAFGVRRIW